MVKESDVNKPLSDFIKIKHGFAFKGDYITQEDNGIVLVTPGNFKIGGGFKEQKCKFYSGDIPSEYILSPRDLIVTMTDLSKDGDTLGYGAFVPLSKNRTYLHNQRIGLIEFIDNLPIDYLYWYLRSNMYQKNIVSSASGSTVKHTSPDRICQQAIPIPTDSVMNKYVPVLENIDLTIANNELECLELAALRDTLLPRLMNGEIDVSAVKI